MWMLGINASWFVCCVVGKYTTVAVAPPIVKYMKGWTKDQVRTYVQKRGWVIDIDRELI